MRFNVSDVKVERFGARTASHMEHMKRLVQSPIEAVSRPPKGDRVVASLGMHQFVAAVGTSFARHYPLILSPDSVWITIAQGLANHINRHAEGVRRRFVAHDGKAQIVIRRDNFIKGAQDNDWEGAFGEFSEKIKDHIGPANHGMIVSDFTTTRPVERAASEVVLMDAMKSYFEYGMMTMCGIPHIELTGSVEDWERLRYKMDGWVFDGGADLSWWTTPLKRVLDVFIAAAKGAVDLEWWRSFYKENEGFGSGAVSKVSGWINWLFPYIKDHRDELVPNPKVGVSGLEYGDGLKEEDYPGSLSKAPFQWNYFGKVFDMELLAGISAIVQDPVTCAVSPSIGWGVREVGVAKKSKIRW